MLYFYLKKRPPTEESIGIPLLCHTKRTSEPKMPYSYLIKKLPLASKSFLELDSSGPQAVYTIVKLNN